MKHLIARTSNEINWRKQRTKARQNRRGYLISLRKQSVKQNQ